MDLSDLLFFPKLNAGTSQNPLSKTWLPLADLGGCNYDHTRQYNLDSIWRIFYRLRICIGKLYTDDNNRWYSVRAANFETRRTGPVSFREKNCSKRYFFGVYFGIDEHYLVFCGQPANCTYTPGTRTAFLHHNYWNSIW